MRKIHKIISLEPMTSRLPSVVPSYKDDQLYFFDDEHLKERSYAYTSNYGMIPSDIIIPSRFNICNINNIKKVSGNNCRVISFERLSQWYFKFKEYYHLLNDYGHCGVVYSSATEYYDNEVKRWSQDLYYGDNRETYEKLDDDITCMGGVPHTEPININIDCSGNIEEKKHKTIDNGFYNWICNYAIPTYIIPKEYQNYWNRQTLYYPDVIQWIGWFKDRNAEYSSYADVSSCKATSNCCDCEEYINRGGNNIYTSMTAWYNSIQSNIIELNNEIDSNGCSIPTMIMPLHIENSLDNIGSFSLFCEEYKVGIDYRVADGYNASENTKGGTIVVKDNKPLKLVNGKKGYKYDTTYMESSFDSSDWDDIAPTTKETEVSGITASKLRTLASSDALVDDIGNKIEGLYKAENNYNHQPIEGSVLEPLYQVGNMSNGVKIEGDDNEFTMQADKITSMLFYLRDYDGNIVEATYTEASNSSLSAINECLGKKTEDIEYLDDVYCKVTYDVGNTYQVTYNGSSASTVTIDSGITYTEEVKFEKQRVEYYLKKDNKLKVPTDEDKPKEHSISYPIYIYKLVQNEETIDKNVYNTPYDDNLAEFSFKTTRSGYTQTPTMIENHMFGISAPQSVEGDIYIDRGINSSFEKHLKLGEISTFEALTKMGNGYYKIMDN